NPSWRRLKQEFKIRDCLPSGKYQARRQRKIPGERRRGWRSPLLGRWGAGTEKGC
ncbi:hypothetical protein U1Q18_042595, partial [Sarracenia purpurea var. burkii]